MQRVDLSSAWRTHGNSARLGAASTSIPTMSARVCAERWSGCIESSLHIRDCFWAGEYFSLDRPPSIDGPLANRNRSHSACGLRKQAATILRCEWVGCLVAESDGR